MTKWDNFPEAGPVGLQRGKGCMPKRRGLGGRKEGPDKPPGLQVSWEAAQSVMRTRLQEAGKRVTSKPGQRPSSGQAFRTWDTQQ